MSNDIIRVTSTVSDKAHQPAQTDETLIDLWVHGRRPSTIRAYRSDAYRFLGFVGKTLSEVSLAEVQGFADSLTGQMAPASTHRCLSSVKSIFAFGHRLGYLPFDTARALRLPVLRDRLTERILSEDDVRRMISLERHPRNHLLLLLLYTSGIRVSECCGLKWRDLHERTGGNGQITVLGKGAKTNSILLPASIFTKLMSQRQDASEDTAIFKSRKGRHLHATQVRRIVRHAARRAGITKAVSPHWMRHAHASHALDNGAPIHLVQQTLGHASVATTGRYLHVRPDESSGSFLST